LRPPFGGQFRVERDQRPLHRPDRQPDLERRYPVGIDLADCDMDRIRARLPLDQRLEAAMGRPAEMVSAMASA